MKYKKALQSVTKVFAGVIITLFFALIVGSVYVFGYIQGISEGQTNTENFYTAYVSSVIKELSKPLTVPTPSQIQVDQNQTPTAILSANNGLLRQSNWGGPDLWASVNTRRTQFGVNPLDQRDDLCTIASIRLNELLKLGDLDGHEGFSNMTERRPDLKPIFERYSTVAEFLAAGANSANETVALWENSLGHKKLLTGGEYVWGCIYAQNSFAVAISAF